jgi:hypothetical protein
MTVR